jgi:hypothetical protein
MQEAMSSALYSARCVDQIEKEGHDFGSDIAKSRCWEGTNLLPIGSLSFGCDLTLDVWSPFGTFDEPLIADRLIDGEARRHKGQRRKWKEVRHARDAVAKPVAAKPKIQRFKSVRRRGVTRGTAAIRG